MSLEEKLIVDTSDGVSQVSALQQVFNNLTSALNSNAKAASASNRTYDQFFKSNARLINSIGQLAPALGRNSGQLASNVKQVNALTIGSNNLTLTWGSVIRIFESQLIFRALNTLTSTLADTSKEARELEIVLARIQGIDSLARSTSLDVLAEQQLDFVRASGQGIDKTVAGFYDLISNQVGDSASAQIVFNNALDLTVTTGASASQAVNLLTAEINSYNSSILESKNLSSQFFKTVDFGRVQIGELADTAGRLFPIGSELGVQTSEILALIAAITQTGVKTSEAVTQVSGIFQALLKPTEALKKAYVDLGITSIELEIATKGIVPTLQKIRGALGETASATALGFSNVRAFRGVIAATGSALGLYNKSLEGIRDTQDGAAETAKKLVQATAGFQVQTQLEVSKAILVNELGRGLNAFFVQLGDRFATLEEITIGFVKTLELLGQSAITTANVLTLGQFDSAPNQVRTASPLKEFVADQEKLRQESIRIQQDIVSETLALDDELTRQRIANIDDYFRVFRTRLSEQLREARLTEAQISRSLEVQIDSRVNALEQFANRNLNIQVETERKIRALTLESASDRFSAESSLFDRNQARRRTEQERDFAIQKRIRALLSRANTQKQNPDNTQLAESSLNEAAKLAESLASKRRSAETLVNQVLRARLSLNTTLINQEKQKALEVEQASQVAFESATRARTLAADLKDINKGLADKSRAGQLTPEEARKEFSKILKLQSEFDATLKKAGATFTDIFRTPDFKREAALILRDFQSAVTGKPVTLEFAIKEGASALISKLQSDFDKAAPLNIRKSLSEALGVGLEATDTERASALNELQRELSQTASDLATYNTLLDASRSRQADAATSAKAFAEELAKVGAATTQRLRNLANPALMTEADLSREIPDQTQTITGVNLITTRFTELEAKARAFAQAVRDNPLLNPEEQQQIGATLSKDILAIGSQAAQISEITGRVFAPEDIRNFSLELQRVVTLTLEFGKQSREQDEGLKKSEGLKSRLETIEQSIQALRQLGIEGPQVTQVIGAQLTQTFGVTGPQSIQSTVNSLGQLGPAATTASTSISAASTNIVGRLNAIETAARRAAAAVSSVGGGAGASGGGAAGFANGGAVGVDNVFAVLNRGESVLRAEASRAFQAHLANVGFSSRNTFSNGSSNVSVGDIHVNINGADGKSISGDSIARSLKKSLRRRLTTLNPKRK